MVYGVEIGLLPVSRTGTGEIDRDQENFRRRFSNGRIDSSPLHGALGAQISNCRTGLTSMLPTRAEGMVAATLIASSRSGTSIM